HHWLPRVQKKPPLQLATASNPLLGSRLTPLTVTLAATALLVPERSVTLTSTSRTTLLFPLAMVPLMGVPEWSIEAVSGLTYTELPPGEVVASACARPASASASKGADHQSRKFFIRSPLSRPQRPAS